MSKIDEVVAAVARGVEKPLPEAARPRSQHHPGQDVRAAASAEMAQTSGSAVFGARLGRPMAVHWAQSPA